MRVIFVLLWVATAGAQDPAIDVDGDVVGEVAFDGDAPTDPEGLAPVPRWIPLAEAPRWCERPPRLDWRDAEWCDRVPPGCEGLTQACERHVPEIKSAGFDAAPRLTRPPTIDLSTCAGGGGYVILGLLLGLVVMAVASWLFGPKDARDAPVDAGGADTPVGAAVRVARSEDELLVAARQAVEGGRFAEALLLVRAAIVRALERSGTLPADPGRTDRETVRALAAEPGLAADVKVVASALERQRYASLPVDRRTMDAVLDAGRRVLTKVGVLVVLFGVSIAQAGPADHDRLVDWLEQHDVTVEETTEFPEDGDIVIWMPDAWWDGEGAARARHSARLGAIVIVVGDATTLALFDEDVGGWTQAALPVRPDPTLAEGAPLDVPAAWKAGAAPGRVLFVDKDGAAVGLELPVGEDGGALRLVGVPNLLDDAALLSAGNAAALGALLDESRDRHVTIVRLEDGAANPLRMVLAAGLGPALAQLLVLWLVWAWARGRRFAAPVPAPDEARRDFRAHLDAVAALYRGVGASRAGLAAVASRTLHVLRERTRANESGLAEAVAARTGEPPERVADLVKRARAAADPSAPAGDADLDLQEELWKLAERTKSGGKIRSARSPRGSRR
ncbi:MAG: DUF4129 domain-containing protein [Myxococcota bacterium]